MPGVTGIAASAEGDHILVIDANDDVQRFDAATGEALGRLVKGKRAGIQGGNFLAWR